MLNMNEVAPILDAVIEQVLETMFLSSLIWTGEPDGVPEGDVLTAVVNFTGPHSGTLAVRAAEPVAVALISKFLADEEPSHETAALILGETANVVCGSLLGRVMPGGHFEIARPRMLELSERVGVWESSKVRRSIEVGEGRIDFALALI